MPEFLAAQTLPDTAADEAALPAGRPSSDDTQILQTADIDLENYPDSKLATAATKFTDDEQNYDFASARAARSPPKTRRAANTSSSSPATTTRRAAEKLAA